MPYGPIVQFEERDAWEQYIFEYWDSHPEHIPPGAGYQAWGRGIYARTNPLNPYETYHMQAPNYFSTNQFMVPVAQSHFTSVYPSVILGWDTHSFPLFSLMIDKTIECVESSDDYDYITSQCIRTSPVFKSTFEADAVVMSFNVPVVLEQNNTLVGSFGGLFSFINLLVNSIPTHISGVDVVMTIDGYTFTHYIKNGVPEWKGEGRLVESEYSKHKMAKSVVLPDKTKSVLIEFYPRATFVEEYTTNIPLIVALASVLMILFCCTIFIIYDLAVIGESTRKQLVLDTKRRFVRFISHEIRTPLNTVRLGLKLFELEIVALGKEVRRLSPAQLLARVKENLANWKLLTDDVLGNTEAAVDVLNDLLNYDKIESGTLRLEFAAVGVWDLVKRVHASFLMQAKQKDQTLQLVGDYWSSDTTRDARADFQNVCVIGDSTRLAQVLRNLLSNALKFTPEEGKVTIRAEWVKQGLVEEAKIDMPPDDDIELLDRPQLGAVVISVTDSGAGLSPENLAQICKEGIQFNVNQLQAGGGSGLGLFISKGIVEQHGGTLVVDSEGLGKGATFTVTLPLFSALEDKELYSNEDLDERDKDNIDSFDDAIDTLAPLVVKRVLCVDDALSNRKLLMRILKARGYECEDAEDGQKAVDKYKAAIERGAHFDAILTDFEMPVMDGPTAVKQIRALGCDCFIVGVTGNVMQSDIDHFKAHGADAVLAKPLNTDVFESLWRNFHLGGRLSTALNGEPPPTLRLGYSKESCPPESSALSPRLRASSEANVVGLGEVIDTTKVEEKDDLV